MAVGGIIPGTDTANPALVVPIFGQRPVLGSDHAGELRARIRVRRSGRPPADDRRRQHGRGAGERAPVRRDAAAAEGNRAAQRRARGHQQHPAGHRRASSTSRPSSTSSATSCAKSSRPTTSGSAGTIDATNLRHFLYAYEHGQRLALPSTHAASSGDRHAMLSRTRRPLVTRTRAEVVATRHRRSSPGTDGSKSRSCVPIFAGDRVLGIDLARELRARVRVRRIRRAPAADASPRHGRRAGERAAVRRDAAARARDARRWPRSAATFRPRSTCRR